MALQDAPFADVVEVLNYALTLEHLEATFYREAVEMFDAAAYEAIGFQASVRDRIVAIAEQEASHVDALTAVIEQMEGTPVEEATYDFGYTDLTSFLATAAVIENLGVSAYQGAAQYLIEEDALLTAALTIHGNEARHAAYLNMLTGASPFPAATDSPVAPADVLEAATPFFVS
jgi:bacterioferritin (cytochrome b1)